MELLQNIDCKEIINESNINQNICVVILDYKPPSMESIKCTWVTCILQKAVSPLEVTVYQKQLIIRFCRYLMKNCRHICVSTKNNTELAWRIIKDISISSLLKKPLAIR